MKETVLNAQNIKKRDQFKTGCITAAGLLEGNALKNELVC